MDTIIILFVIELIIQIFALAAILKISNDKNEIWETNCEALMNLSKEKLTHEECVSLALVTFPQLDIDFIEGLLQ